MFPSAQKELNGNKGVVEENNLMKETATESTQFRRPNRSDNESSSGKKGELENVQLWQRRTETAEKVSEDCG